MFRGESSSQTHGAAAGAGKRLPDILYCLLPAVSFALAVLLGVRAARFRPDATYYRLLALGRWSVVPSPFSDRVLGPFLARWLGRANGNGVDRGFLLAGLASLGILLVCEAKLLRFGRAQLALAAAVFLMPFWVDLFHDYYLPDLLHAAILAVLLLCLARGQTWAAMVLLFPAYLARESTLLFVLCLAVASWRRLSLRSAGLGALATISGALFSRHFARLGAPGIEGLQGGSYLAGKFAWSFARNVLGLAPWTNTLQGCQPFWVTELPGGHSFGNIHLVGLCHPSLWGPARVLLAWFGIFGVGPALALALFRPIVASLGFPGKSVHEALPSRAMAVEGRDGDWRGGNIVYRVSILYGAVTVLLAPILGASTDRLVQYAWPLYLVALPWFVAAHPRVLRGRGALILFLHLLISWVAWEAFRSEKTHIFFYAGVAAFAVNVIVYFLLRPAREVEIPLEQPGHGV